MSIDIGTVTGIIGAISGVAGSIMGFIAFRHSRELKTADRRIELEKLRNKTHLLSVQLTDILPVALKSKERILAAIGKFNSGDMQIFKEEYERDSAKSLELAKQIPRSDTDFKHLSRKQLEGKIVELDRTKGWIEELLNKYQESLNSDKERRKEISMQRSQS